MVAGDQLGAVLPVARAVAFADLCPEVAAQFDAWSQRADDHNAPAGSVNTYDHAAVDAYNAEKAQLETERSALKPRVDACTDAAKVAELKDPGGAPLAKPSAEKKAAIDATKQQIPAGYQPPT
ncbi:hypothetical protein [Mycobacterium sp. 155]|uniref:hypothetical protein n=1 Tax=Mycobacterium sp. 155 TaxID=1157943 RepID=UPI00037537CF|nr:hypothetical protein [Mycobacterium sp. 155]